MPNEPYTERYSARVALAVEKALTRPEILKYLRDQVIDDVIKYMDTITDKEIDDLLTKVKNAKTKAP